MDALAGKVAVVTGATSGIGQRIAEVFAAEGATVVIAGRRAELGQTLAEKLGPHAEFVRTDVGVEAEVAELIARTVRNHAGLDILVNNAGDYGPGGTLAELDLDRFGETVAVHVGGVLAGMKHAAPVLLAQGHGSIVNISSITGRLAGWAGLGYSAAKAAVLSATRSAAIELGEHGIRVNSVSPGPILTGIFAKGAGMDPAAADTMAPELGPTFVSVLRRFQPIRRAGVPDDVAAAALFLASDAAAFVNGHDLVVDGGISAGRPAVVAIEERAELGAAFAAIARR